METEDGPKNEAYPLLKAIRKDEVY